MRERMKDKVIVVSGGCGDLGAATARRVSEEGARVVLLDIRAAAEGEACARQNGAAAYYVCDQSDRDAIDRVLAQAQREFGRLDVAIANAGLVRRAPFLDISAVSYTHLTLPTNREV